MTEKTVLYERLRQATPVKVEKGDFLIVDDVQD